MTKRILIVDDEESVAFFLGENLAELGPNFAIETAYSAEDALDRFALSPYDLLITDLRLPGLNGLDLIRELHQRALSTACILITAYGSEGVAEEARRLDVFRYITKPFAVEELIAAARQALATPRILVMEDDAYTLNLYGKALRQSGWDVHLVETLEQATDLLARAHFDVFVCDIHIGRQTALDLLCEQFVKLHEAGTQIIVVSADAQYREDCDQLAIDFYYQKPVSISDLVLLVDRLVKVPAMA